MALIRVCDLTGNPGAVATPIRVGRYRGQLDLDDAGVKTVLEALSHLVSLVETDDPILEDDPYPVVLQGVIPGVQTESEPDDDEDQAAGDDEPEPVSGAELRLTLTPTEREACRAWGMRHWKRIGLPKEPSGHGQISAVLAEAWHRAKRPDPRG